MGLFTSAEEKKRKNKPSWSKPIGKSRHELNSKDYWLNGGIYRKCRIFISRTF